MRIKTAAVALSLAFVPSIRADFTETFENNSNSGGWFFTTNPVRINQIEPTGGNPGAWLHGTENAGAPSVQTAIDETTGAPLGSSPFTGDYASRGVTRLSVDAQTLNGDNDKRGFSVALYDWAGGDIDNALQAFTTNQTIPVSGAGWRGYNFNLKSSGTEHIPAGWTLLRGDGQAATVADWSTLMEHVDQVQFVWGEFGFAYPLHTVWDLGIDNVRINERPLDASALVNATLTPEPALMCLPLLLAPMLRRRRVISAVGRRRD